ncbi:MAG: FAD-binding protein [Bdellovibrio sp.]|nr:FAD-binding protein [Bdellovibrio sp.]
MNKFCVAIFILILYGVCIHEKAYSIDSKLYSSQLDFHVSENAKQEWYTRSGLLEKQSAKGIKQAIDEVDNWVQKTPEFLCPGTGLALSCGNKICEESKGENWETCLYDCLKVPVVSYNGETFCSEVQKILTPQNALDVQDIVLQAIETGYRLRVSGKAHTINSQICTDGIVISTEKLNKIMGMEIYQGNTTVQVEAGVTLGQLTSWLHERGMSLGYAIMAAKTMTVAGAVATGAHGSSTRETATISSLVESLTMVNPQGEIVEYNSTNTDENLWRALRANLGMLGVVVDLRLRIREQYNLHTSITFKKEKLLFQENGLKKLISKCDHARVHWFPKGGTLMQVCGNETNRSVDRGAESTLINVPPLFQAPLKFVIHEGACHKDLNCLLEGVIYQYTKFAPPLLKQSRTGKMVHTKEVTGYSHRILSSDVPDLKTQFFQTDWEIAVPLSSADEVLEALRDYFKSNKICLPFLGLAMRFVPIEDTTLLAHTSAGRNFKPGELAVTFEIIAYNPIGFPPEMEASYQKYFEEFASQLVYDFGGRGHLAKNRDWIFEIENQLGSYGDNLEKFQEILNKLDPNGLFSNDFGKRFGFEWKNRREQTCSGIQNWVCSKNKMTYQNPCRANLDGVQKRDLLMGKCDDYEFKSWGLLGLKSAHLNSSWLPEKIWILQDTF